MQEIRADVLALLAAGLLGVSVVGVALAESGIAWTAVTEGPLGDEIFVGNVTEKDTITSVRNVTNRAGKDWNPSWSRWGRRLAFISDRDRPQGVYVMDFTNGVGGTARRVDPNAGEEVVFTPGWDPTGRKLAYITTAMQLFSVPIDAGGPPELVADLGARQQTGLDPVWSPDGTKIALAGWSVKIVDVESGMWVELDGLDCTHVDWSERGICLIRNVFGKPWIPPRLMIVDEDGKVLTWHDLQGFVGAGYPSYSPDLRRVVFEGTQVRDEPSRLYVLDLVTRAVTDTGVFGTRPDWGRALALSVDGPAGQSLPFAWGAIRATGFP